MGIFSKLAFWKKKEGIDLGNDFGADLGLGAPDLGLPSQSGTRRDTGWNRNMNLGMSEDIGFGGMQQPPGQPAPTQQPFGTPIQPPPPTERDYARDKFEVVSAKLDSIRYTLESINQRLTNLERMAYGQEEKKRW